MTRPRSAPALLLAALMAGGTVVAPAQTPEEQAAFLDTLEQRTFRWFWEHSNPANGLVPDRTPSATVSSIAATGFGLTAWGIGTERGYITRDQAVARTLATLRFFSNAPMGTVMSGVTGYRGLYYHFLNMQSGMRDWTCELSTIDTGLLMMGVLFAREYFDRPTADEMEIRSLADALYLRADWAWLQPSPPLMGMGWFPESGPLQASYRGWDEAMFLYVLGMGSPTYGLNGDAWSAYTGSYAWGSFQGRDYVQFEPLFGYQYAHCWIDPRGLADAYLRSHGIDCLEHSRRATYANRAYCASNPRGFRDYGDNIWGLSAGDGPINATFTYNGQPLTFHTYWARGASQRYANDDGTITPTAAGGSIALTPEISVPALMAMAARYGDRVYGIQGFVDGFNPSYAFSQPALGWVDPTYGWFDSDQLGIDQGPILLAIENLRSGLVWNVMRRSPYIARGLALGGFTADWLNPGSLRALSLRGKVGTGDDVMIAGFALQGGGGHVLAKAVGPSIGVPPYSVPGVLADPLLTLRNHATGVVLASNDDWGGTAELIAANDTAGAMPMPDPTSKDSMLLAALPEGLFTATASGKSGGTGVALIELYSVDTPSKLSALSMRGWVGTGAEVYFAGISVQGSTSKSVLFKAIGPSIAPPPYNVPGTMADPRLEILRVNGDGSHTLIGSNEDWGGAALLQAANARAGAFPVSDTTSKDAMILLTLPPGLYIAKVSGVGDTTGVVLLEVYGL